MATRTIGTELVLQGEKAFNDGMKAVNANLKNIKSDMALVTAEFDGNADSMEALTAKQKVLRESVDQHRAKVNALQQMYDKQKEAYGENSAQADKYKQQLNAATVALLKEQKALDKTTEAIEDQKKETKKLEDVTEDSTKETEKASKSQNKLAAAAEKAAKRQELLSKAAAGMGKTISAAAKLTIAAVAALSTAGIASFVSIANIAKESADAAKAAYEAGEDLTRSQQQWLAFSQRLDSLNWSFNNAKDVISRSLIPALEELATEGSGFLDWFSQDFEEAAGNAELQAEVIGKYVALGVNKILDKIPEYKEAGRTILGAAIDGFQEYFDSDSATEDSIAFIESLVLWLLQNTPPLAEAGLELATQVLDGFNGKELGGAAGTFVADLSNAIVNAAPELLSSGAELVVSIGEGFLLNIDELLLAAWKAIGTINDGLSRKEDLLREAGSRLLNALFDGLASSDNAVLQFCGNLLKSIKDGITEGWSGLVTWWTGLWDSLFGGLHAYFYGHGDGTVEPDGSHRNGLQYVPYDGYLAELHRGERVLTAQEADAYRSGKGNGVTVNIYPQSISPAEMDAIVEYANGKLGDDL